MNDVLDDQTSLRDGRYEGGNESFLIELRIDVGGSGVISGDLFRADTPGHEHLSSVRTAAGIEVALPSGTWPARWDTYQGRTSTGAIAFGTQAQDTATAKPDSQTTTQVQSPDATRLSAARIRASSSSAPNGLVT